MTDDAGDLAEAVCYALIWARPQYEKDDMDSVETLLDKWIAATAETRQQIA